ncbi:MAG: 3-phenylpropionic acid transporter [Microgenomates group bacterium GW2011_GWC1_44_37]|uniref:3-phenylpropionic acid transporter n=1 Tax=Candidatus Collierbacteria bacterium GW2011_GWB2_44_22 TaxID=1618387 RepID=A0A0G1KVA3_9BACT|nr:MAG: 3-phenylpropionic acid transporter [Candidatus Collierbacteria bacterium GW2011_GWA2_44_13]KKT51834.1 MAG: 3-phenylpropionic acid transporter [Candidatus Collierbacteria bacterium GW2011_GWB2_44_22]KKT61693.1 MAG: 3-phenylpropionic acid transporter [Candidatus Collierbacteria bacterium GW2011_GWD1_44_27]KKT68665.1 MAG: 3-phenylpropionic acid transporter [Microgenomates group bacterium GW2011_GWC1_44_37]
MLSVMLFFVYVGDGILSDWVPSFIQNSVNSPLLMGIIISFSSLVGFGADLIFPQLLKHVKTRKVLLMAIGSSLVFCGVLLWSVAWPLIVLFLLAMGVWGVYYEFLGFGGQAFVSESVPVTARSGVWAVMSAFRSLAYFIGPILGSYLAISKGDYWVVMVATVCVALGYLVWMIMGRSNRESVVDEPAERVSLLKEIQHWWTLSERVWPVLAISLMMGIVDATYWTTGTVFSDNLAKQNWWGGLFLPLYTLPMVFVGVVIARWGVYKGKKKLAEIFMLISGLLLVLIGPSDSVIVALTVSLLVGTMLSVSWPMTDAVYSDIVSRMGSEGKHMVGLSGSTLSVAYIVGPIIAGLISQFVGEKNTFVVMGIVLTLVSLCLLVVTPKKLRLPQAEIKTWDD